MRAHRCGQHLMPKLLSNGLNLVVPMPNWRAVWAWLKKNIWSDWHGRGRAAGGSREQVGRGRVRAGRAQ